MAISAAELKARMAKYAKAVEVKSEEPNSTTSESNQTPTGSVVQSTTDVSKQVASTEQLVVVTDLQPTTLIVVERPAMGDSGVPDIVRGGDLQGSEASTNLDVTNPVHQGFLQRLHDLERALLERDPLMRTHLAEIHKSLIQYEEITSLLTTEEIAKIMAAQQVHTNTVLVQETVKKTAKSVTAKAAKLSMDDV